MSAKPSQDPGVKQDRRGLRAGIAVLTACAALLLVHALAWHWLTGEIEVAFRSWADSRREAGWQVRHEAPRRGGWPLAATVMVPRLEIEGATATVPGGFAWSAPELVLRLSLPRLDRLVAEPRGALRLRIGEAEYPFAADRIEIATPFEPGASVRRADGLAERLRIGTPQGPLELQGVAMRMSLWSSATEGEPALALAVSAHGLELPREWGGQAPIAALGRRIETIGFEGTISGPIAFASDMSVRAEAWREGGGTVEIGALAVTWGPVQGTVRMTLTLDDALQPMGAGQLRMTGASEAVEALRGAGAIAPRTARAARAAVALLARRPDPQSPPQIELPVTLDDRHLSVGAIPLLRFHVVEWPSAPLAPDEVLDPSLPVSR